MNGWRRLFVVCAVILAVSVWWSYLLQSGQNGYAVGSWEMAVGDSLATARMQGDDTTRLHRLATTLQEGRESQVRILRNVYAVGWVVLCLLLYAAGASIAWVRRGFRRTLEVEVVEE